MKRVLVIVLALMMVLSLAACGSKEDYSAYVVGKSFVYEKDGIMGDFIIDIKDDGTFFYSEGAASSYLGIGSWSIKDNTITLSDESHTNVFRIEKEKLIWVSDGSDNFTYIQVKDGEQFNETENVPVEEPKWDYPPMVMVDGKLYLDTGHKSTVEGRCGMMDGKITSMVPQTEKPTENDQSNFGVGYEYQYGPTEGTIELFMNDEWWVYAVEEDVPIQSGTSESVYMAIGIDDVTYVNTGNAIPVEPDESVIEYVEIPVGGDSKITAYAWLNKGKTLVCLVDHEWYEFSPYATLLTGKVLELADGKMLIKPDDKIGAADTAVVIVPMVNMHPSPEPVVGDSIEVIYNGTLPTPSNDNGTPVYDLSGNHIEGIQVVR